MGNGVGVQASQFDKLSRGDISQFDDIEKRCKRGFYHTRTDEFRQELRDAIKRSRIDILEVLLSSGCVAQGIYPLHLAATYGSVDSMELLISAGYSATSLDSHSRTPLHCCAQCRTPEGPTCADYLCFQNKKALVMRDMEGCTPLLTSVSRQNVPVVRVLLQHGAKAVSITDKRGRSPRDVALESQNQELIDAVVGKKGAAQEVKKTKEQKQVDEARIMAIWEKFFENCFLTMEAEASQDAGLMYDRASVQHIAQQQQRDLHSSGGGRDNKVAVYAHARYQDPSLYDEAAGLSDHVAAWFDWKLCSNLTEPDGEEYYVINTSTYSSKWLSALVMEYSYAIKKTQRSYLRMESFECSTKSGRHSVNVKDDEVEYPLTAEDLFQQGWISFYDVEHNECYWMQLATGRCEKYLPIGDDYDNVVNLGLEFYEDDIQWVRPNQYPCTQSWVCIPSAPQEDIDNYYAEPLRPPDYDTKYEPSWMAESKNGGNEEEYKESGKYNISEPYEYDPEGDNNGYKWDEDAQEWVYQYPEQQQEENCEYNNYYDTKVGQQTEEAAYYFYNTFSGQSVWAEPVGWQAFVEAEWNGWWLCRDELTGIEYWWNPETNESQLI